MRSCTRASASVNKSTSDFLFAASKIVNTSYLIPLPRTKGKEFQIQREVLCIRSIPEYPKFEDSYHNIFSSRIYMLCTDPPLVDSRSSATCSCSASHLQRPLTWNWPVLMSTYLDKRLQLHWGTDESKLLWGSVRESFVRFRLPAEIFMEYAQTDCLIDYWANLEPEWHEHWYHQHTKRFTMDMWRRQHSLWRCWGLVMSYRF